MSFISRDLAFRLFPSSWFRISLIWSNSFLFSNALMSFRNEVSIFNCSGIAGILRATKYHKRTQYRTNKSHDELGSSEKFSILSAGLRVLPNRLTSSGQALASAGQAVTSNANFGNLSTRTSCNSSRALVATQIRQSDNTHTQAEHNRPWRMRERLSDEVQGNMTMLPRNKIVLREPSK